VPKQIGIDLGTTNSLVARVRDGRPMVILDCNGKGLLPSVVHYDERGGVIVGDDARVGANAVVLDDVPAGTTAVGMPARVVG